MKKLSTFILFMALFTMAWAQPAQVRWSLSDLQNLQQAEITGEGASCLGSAYLEGTNIAKRETITGPNAAAGFTAVPYDPVFTAYYSDTRVTSQKAGYCVSFGATPTAGHTFKPLRIAFDACKVGTDGGNFDVVVKPSGGTEVTIASGVSPLRNRVGEGNPYGYGHYEYTVSDQLVKDKAFIVIIYMYNLNGTDNTNPKAIALRNVELSGVIDEPIYTAEHYLTSFTCKSAQGDVLDLTSLLQGLSNGVTAAYPTHLQGDPTDFEVQAAEG